jgi:hypothetical protein
LFLDWIDRYREAHFLSCSINCLGRRNVSKLEPVFPVQEFRRLNLGVAYSYIDGISRIADRQDSQQQENEIPLPGLPLDSCQLFQ